MFLAIRVLHVEANGLKQRMASFGAGVLVLQIVAAGLMALGHYI